MLQNKFNGDKPRWSRNDINKQKLGEEEKKKVGGNVTMLIFLSSVPGGQKIILKADKAGNRGSKYIE